MKERSRGLDLLRLTAMVLVVCQHILGQGGVLASAAPGSGRYLWLQYLQNLSFCAVDVFGLVTGWLLCRKPFRLGRLTKLWLTTAFWSVAVSCVCFAVLPESRSVKEAISMFLPLLRGRYWFFTAYFVTVLLSPVLNLVLRSLTGRQLALLLAALLAFFTLVPVAALGNDVLRIHAGQHFVWLAVLYLLGGYGRLHGKSLRMRWPLAGFFGLGGVQLLFQWAVCAAGAPQYRELLLCNNSLLVLGEAVCLFAAFRKLRHPSGGVLSALAPGVWAVYVIHTHPLLFWNDRVIALFRPWDSLPLWAVTAALVLCAVSIAALCVLLDWLRQRLMKLTKLEQTAQRLSDRAETALRALWKG